MKEIQLSSKRKIFYVKKGKKYLTGHGYASGIGYSFNWSLNIKEGRKMNLFLAIDLSQRANGKIIYLKK